MTTDRRRWCRLAFSLRTLLLFVTLFGGWLGYQLKWIRQRHEYLEQPAARGYGIWWLCLRRPAPLSLRMFREEGIHQFNLYLPESDSETASELQRVQRLFPEAYVVARPAPPVEGYHESLPSGFDPKPHHLGGWSGW